MKTLLQVIEQKSNYTSNLGLKFSWWALETIIHRFYSQGFEYKILHAPYSTGYFLICHFGIPLKKPHISFLGTRLFGKLALKKHRALETKLKHCSKFSMKSL